MGVFVVSKRADEKYKFEFVSRKGKVIFMSGSYELRFECEDDVLFLKKEIQNAVFMKFKTSSGKFYFRIIVNEKEIATSRKYATQLLMQRGIDEILRSLSSSEMLDFSISAFSFPDEKDLFQD